MVPAAETRTSFSLSQVASFRTFMVSVLTVALSVNMLSLTAAKRADAHNGGFQFEYVTVTLLQESCKLIVACFFVQQEQEVRLRKKLAVQDSGPNLQALLAYGIPALIYCFDNNFQYVILEFLQPAELAILWNFKIFATTLLLSHCLGRHYTWQQWGAMVALVLGCVATQAPQLLDTHRLSAAAVAEPVEESGLEAASEAARLGFFASISLSDKTIGALLALLGSSVAASGNVFCEWLVKKDRKDSIHVQNVRLYGFGVLMNLGTLLTKVSLDPASPIHGPNGFFTGYNRYIWAVVVCGTLNGILVSFTLRYVDNIAIIFGHALAMLLGAFLSAEVFAVELTNSFLFGGALVLAALYVFYTSEADASEFNARSGATEKLATSQKVPMYCLQKDGKSRSLEGTPLEA